MEVGTSPESNKWPGIGGVCQEFRHDLVNLMNVTHETGLGSSRSDLLAAYIAKTAMMDSIPLRDVIDAATYLVQEGMVLRLQISAALSSHVSFLDVNNQTMQALSVFSKAKLWSFDDLLTVLDPASRASFASALVAQIPPDTSVYVACAGPKPESLSAAEDLLAQLVCSAYAGTEKNPARCMLEAVRQELIPGLDSVKPNCLGMVSNGKQPDISLGRLLFVFQTVSENVSPPSVAQRFLLKEIQALLTSRNREYEDRNSGMTEAGCSCKGRIMASQKELDDAIHIVALKTGPLALLEILKSCVLRRASICWTAGMCIIKHCQSVPGKGICEQIQELLKEAAALALESASEAHMRMALMLARAVHMASVTSGELGCLQSADYQYENWFSGLVSGAPTTSRTTSPTHFQVSSCGVKAMLVMLRVLTDLVPADTRGILVAQRSVLSRVLRKTPTAREYMQLAHTRLKELPKDNILLSNKHNESTSAMPLSKEDREEARRRTEEFVLNNYRIPVAFLNTIRNWKRSWFDEHLAPALLEPVSLSDKECEDRGKFLEALAARHLIASSAPRTFLRQSKLAARQGLGQIPEDITLTQVFELLPSRLVHSNRMECTSAIHELEKRIERDLEENGTVAHIASVIDSILELVTSVAHEEGSFAQEWHVFLGRAIGRQEKLHNCFWDRLTVLCSAHVQSLTPNQMNGLASLLVALSVTEADGSPVIMFPGISHPQQSESGILGSGNALPWSSGHALTIGLMKTSITAGLLHASRFAGSIRLCTAYAISALQLTGRVKCSQQSDVFSEARVDNSRIRANAVLGHEDYRPQKLRRTGKVQNAAEFDLPMESVHYLTVPIQPEILHFLQWSVRQSALQGAVAVPAFSELSPDDMEDLTASVQVAEEFLSSHSGHRLSKVAGSVPLHTFIWIESIAVAGGLSSSILADVAARQFQYGNGIFTHSSLTIHGVNSHSSSSAIQSDDMEKPFYSAHDVYEAIQFVLSSCTLVLKRLPFHVQLNLSSALYAVTASLQQTCTQCHAALETEHHVKMKQWTDELKTELLHHASRDNLENQMTKESKSVVDQLVRCLLLRLPHPPT